MEIFFLICLLIIFYTYIGYGLLLFILIKLLRWFKPVNSKTNANNTPSLTLIVAAFNEAGFIKEKIENTLLLEYPADKIEFIFITDGSSDATPEIIQSYPQIRLMHKAERAGKIAAVHRAMKEVNSEIVVFMRIPCSIKRRCYSLAVIIKMKK